MDGRDDGLLPDDSEWRELCRKAAEERDPHRLRHLVHEIVLHLELRVGRLSREPE